jgi:hypothetical protein
MQSARSGWTASASVAGAGVERDAGRRAGLADQVQRVVDVGRRLDVERDVVGAGLEELGNDALGPVDHEVHVEDGLGRQRLAQGRDDERAERDRRDEVPVHHVAVDEPRPGGHDLLDLRGQAREVGREDRRRDAGQTGHSIDAPQWTQVVVPEVTLLAMRTIVACSPQSGHTERSS